MFFRTAAVLAACLMPTLASANDEVLQFQIESELAYLKTVDGISTVEVNAAGIRTEVIIGVDTFASNFSDIMWDTAARASRMSPVPVLLITVEKHSSFDAGGKQLCYLRARKGQVFDGTC